MSPASAPIEEAPAAHATLGPSKADQWINCPASIAMSRKAPKPSPSFAAAEGTVAHALAYEFVTGKIDSLEMGLRVGTIVKQDGFNVPITDEMFDGAVAYKELIDSLREELRAAAKPARIVEHAEKRVHASSVDDEVWGTTDYTLWIIGHKLIVVDYKFGFGIIEAVENEQGALYLIGAVDSLAKCAFTEHEIIIHQPRAGHSEGPVRRWTAPVEWLELFRAKAQKAAIETRSPAARIKAGDHCRWCPAKPFCPEVHKAAQEAAMTTFDAIAPAGGVKAVDRIADVRLMSVAQLGKMLTWEGTVKALFSAAKDVVLERLSAGEIVPGWKLVTGREGNREWIDEAKVVAEFRPYLGMDALYTKKLLSPAALERVVGKKHKIDHLVSREPGEKAIARDFDPRPAVASAAQDAFGVVGVIETTAVAIVPSVAGRLGLKAGQDVPAAAGETLEDLYPKEPCLECELGSCETHAEKKRDKMWPQ